MKSTRYVVGLALIGAALTVVPAVQQAAAGDAPAPSTKGEPTLVQRIQEGARGSVRFSISRATGKTSMARAGRNGDLFPASHARPERKAEAFLATYSRAFGAPRGQLVRADIATDRIGSTTLTYTQRYRGVPVFGAMLKVHVDKARHITAVNGALVPVRGLSLGRTVGKRAAGARAVAVVRAEPPGTEGSRVSTQGIRATDTHLIWYRHGLVKGAAAGRTELAYQVTVTNKKNIRDVVVVSAVGGKVVNRYSMGEDALSRELIEATLKPNGTIQLKEVWHEGQTFPGNLNVDQQNMIQSTGEAYWLFQNTFGRDSYDDDGHVMTTINNDPRIACPNASWNGITTNYCDGVSSDDVVAHEWGHAYTEYTSGLLYQWQPGAMNEAYSDIWGETVDLINGRQDDDEGDIDAPREVGVCSTLGNPLPVVVINSPASVAKVCFAGEASFGPQVTPTGVSGDVVVGTDVAEPANPGTQTPAGTTTDGCSALDNATAMAGKIALLDRGRCGFAVKAKNAQNAGAIGVVIANTLGGGAFGMGGTDPTITVPTLGISNADGDRIRSALVPGPVNVTMKDGANPDKTDSSRWMIGEDSAAFGGAIRDMWSPTCIGAPGKVSDAEYICDEEDNGGVHTNSGVVNHSYSLLVDGGTYNGVTVEGIGLDKAANIYFRAQDTYLTYTSGFPELADALEQSCEDLTGESINELSTLANDVQISPDEITSADCAQVTNVVLAVQLRQDPTSQCGFGPLLQPGDPEITCGEGSTPTTVFSEDFEDGLDGWAATGGGIMRWEATTQIHGDHTGTAARGPDDDIHCTTDPTSADFIATGNIVIPVGSAAPRLSFDNYVATEAGFDGGNVQLNVNGGGFVPIPAAAYTFNAPGNLATLAEGNGNPLAGQPGFSGSDGGSVFGTWGVSQVDLTAAGVHPGDTIRMRLAMGRDACTGNDGWYVDNIAVVVCTQAGGPTGTPTGTPTGAPTATATVTTTPTTTPTATPPTKAVSTTTVKKPKSPPVFTDDFKVKVKVVANGLPATGRVVVKYQGVVIGKGKLVKGKVTITIKKNLAVGKQTLVAKYKGSSTAKPSKKRFRITIVDG